MLDCNPPDAGAPGAHPSPCMVGRTTPDSRPIPASFPTESTLQCISDSWANSTPAERTVAQGRRQGLHAHRAPGRRHHHRHPRRDRHPGVPGHPDNAKDSATQSDVTNMKTAVVAAQTQANGVLRTAPAAVADTGGTTVVTYKMTAGTSSPTPPSASRAKAVPATRT